MVVEGLLGGRVVEWWEEACLAPDQQRMEEEDAVPEDQISMSVNVNNNLKESEEERGHQSTATALLGE